MCPPTYLDTKIPNNKWMEDIPPEQRKVDREIAMKQFHDLYSILSEYALIYIVPPKPHLQDQVYATNFGVYLPHLDNVIILSKFRAEGRSGEEVEAEKFLSELGYECYYCPYYFEGEAELKWVRDNLYIGGYGVRSEEKALDWISENFDAKIIKVKETDPYLYHLDCWIFPLSTDYVLAYEAIEKDTMKEIEKEVNVIPVTKEMAYAGINNSVRCQYTIINADNLGAYSTDSDAYKWEQLKNQKLEEICRQFGLNLYYVELTEYLKSGALLSCLIMHLSREEITLGGT